MSFSVRQEYALLCYKTPLRSFTDLAKLHPTACLLNNRLRNRYTDILPIEETRVKVPHSGTDYINANIVEYKSQELQFAHKVICSQAPLPATFPEFWQMVWQEKVPVICALNRLHEKGEVKGDMYWPAAPGSTCVYGDVRVTFLEHFDLGYDVVVRKMVLKNNVYPDAVARTVYQLHYTGWPDFGVPQSTLPIRELCHLVRFFCGRGVDSGLIGPYVVHCSAGVGRTGTFLATWMVLQSQKFQHTANSTKFREYVSSVNNVNNDILPGYHVKPMAQCLEAIISAEFNILDLVLALRQQRNHGMVQTEEQYHFIYRSLSDELLVPIKNSSTVQKFQGIISGNHFVGDCTSKFSNNCDDFYDTILGTNDLTNTKQSKCRTGTSTATATEITTTITFTDSATFTRTTSGLLPNYVLVSDTKSLAKKRKFWESQTTRKKFRADPVSSILTEFNAIKSSGNTETSN